MKRDSLLENRPFNIVLWGCTGFTGRLTALLAARQWAKDIGSQSFKLAIAGRSRNKLEKLAKSMRKEAEAVVCASSTDSVIRNNNKNLDTFPSIMIFEKWGVGPLEDTCALAEKLARAASVIITTAGPYGKIGEPVLSACVKFGTDYVDITGEYMWVYSMYQKYNKVAEKNKSRIIPCCGFDYLLNDITLALAKREAESFLKVDGVKEEEVLLHALQLCDAEGSRVSEGTMRSIYDSLSKLSLWDFVLGKKHGPFAACTQQPSFAKYNRDLTMPTYCTQLEPPGWVVPTIMGRGVVRYLHWANAVHCARPYGKWLILRVGERAKNACHAMLLWLWVSVQMIFLLILSRFEWGQYVSQRIGSIVLYFSGSARSLNDVEQPGHSVTVQTIVTVERLPAAALAPRGSTLPKKITVTSRFTHGEAYAMTAQAALGVAMTCLALRQNEDCSQRVENEERPFGIGCPSEMLGLETLVTKLRHMGFLIEVASSPETGGHRKLRGG